MFKSAAGQAAELTKNAKRSGSEPSVLRRTNSGRFICTCHEKETCVTCDVDYSLVNQWALDDSESDCDLCSDYSSTSSTCMTAVRSTAMNQDDAYWNLRPSARPTVGAKTKGFGLDMNERGEIKAFRTKDLADVSCDCCSSAVPTVKYNWYLLCTGCADKYELRYHAPNGLCQQRYTMASNGAFSGYTIGEEAEKRKFPDYRKGVKECGICESERLITVYDECENEHVVCIDCRRFSQILQRWSKYKDAYYGEAHKPTRWDFSTVQWFRVNQFPQVLPDREGFKNIR